MVSVNRRMSQNAKRALTRQPGSIGFSAFWFPAKFFAMILAPADPNPIYNNSGG